MKPSESISPALERVRKDIDHWRATRRKFGAMPKELWAAAVVQARRHGVGPVARFLGLGHRHLKDRVDDPTGGAQGLAALRSSGVAICSAAPRASSTPPTEAGPPGWLPEGADDQAPRFMDLTGWCGTTGPGEVSIELCSSDGARMVVRLSGGGDIDAAGLCASFWSRACCS